MTTAPDLQEHDLPATAGRRSGSADGEDPTEVTAQLFERIAASDDEVERKRLQDEVVVVNMPLARGIAGRYRNRGVSNDDLLQVAYVGLVKAVQGFDLSFGRNFLGYAVPTVTGEVKRYFRDSGWTIRPPRRIQELQSRISHASNDLAQTLQRAPRPSEIAEHLDVDVEAVIDALAADGCFSPASLDVPVGEDGSTTVGDTISTQDPDLGPAEARLMLAPAVRQLPARSRRILELRFFHGWTQQQIADDIGVTQMQVSRLLTRILSDLRTELA